MCPPRERNAGRHDRKSAERQSRLRRLPRQPHGLRRRRRRGRGAQGRRRPAAPRRARAGQRGDAVVPGEEHARHPALMRAWGLAGYGLLWAFLALFLVYPLTRIFFDAFSNEAGDLTLANFAEFFGDRFYLRSLWNSLALGVATVITTSILGIAVAWLLVRCEFPLRNTFSFLTLVPIISPPLVGVLGFVFILGRAGTVNVLLMDTFDLLQPVNFMYGLHGVLLVETLHLFPMITLNILDALSKVDPSLEEAAQSVGARGWRRFRDVTLPLTTPGSVSVAPLA